VKREKILREEIEKLIEEGKRPSVQLLSRETEWNTEDVHSVLNSMEKKGEIESYVKEGFNRKIRFVSLKR